VQVAVFEPISSRQLYRRARQHIPLGGWTRQGLRLHYLVDCPLSPLTAYVDRDMWENIVLNLVVELLQVHDSAASRRLAHGDARVVTRASLPCATNRRKNSRPHELPPCSRRFPASRDKRVAPRRQRTASPLVNEGPRSMAAHGACRDRLNLGTIFTVTLPLGRAHFRPTASSRRAAAASIAFSRRSLSRKRLRWLPRRVVGLQIASRAEHRAPGARATRAAGSERFLLRVIARRRQPPICALCSAACSPNATESKPSPTARRLSTRSRRRRPDLVLRRRDDAPPRRISRRPAPGAACRRLHAHVARSWPSLFGAGRRRGAKNLGAISAADDYLVKPFVSARRSVSPGRLQSRQGADPPRSRRAIARRRRATLETRTGLGSPWPPSSISSISCKTGPMPAFS